MPKDLLAVLRELYGDISPEVEDQYQAAYRDIMLLYAAKQLPIGEKVYEHYVVLSPDGNADVAKLLKEKGLLPQDASINTTRLVRYPRELGNDDAMEARISFLLPGMSTPTNEDEAIALPRLVFRLTHADYREDTIAESLDVFGDRDFFRGSFSLSYGGYARSLMPEDYIGSSQSSDPITTALDVMTFMLRGQQRHDLITSTFSAIGQQMRAGNGQRGWNYNPDVK